MFISSPIDYWFSSSCFSFTQEILSILFQVVSNSLSILINKVLKRRPKYHILKICMIPIRLHYNINSNLLLQHLAHKDLKASKMWTQTTWTTNTLLVTPEALCFLKTYFFLYWMCDINEGLERRGGFVVYPLSPNPPGVHSGSNFFPLWRLSHFGCRRRANLSYQFWNIVNQTFESNWFFKKYDHKWRADFQNMLHLLLFVTHLQNSLQQRSQFSTQNLLQMENVVTNWNLE